MRVLEIGCGDKPTVEDGDCVRLDLRPMPHIDLVQSADDLRNIADGAFDRVVAEDVVEHLSWAKVPHALGEWLRVLRPGGVLEVETPNALELAEQILNPSMSTLPRWGDESDWQRFSRTAYGHQDYPENWHGCYFTPAWLTGLLLAAGAERVEVLSESLQRFRLSAVAR